MTRTKTVGLFVLAVLAMSAMSAPASYAAGPKNGEKQCEVFKKGGPNNCNAPLTSGVTIENEKGWKCTAGQLAFYEEAGVRHYYLLTAGHCIQATGEDKDLTPPYPYPLLEPEQEVKNPKCVVKPGETGTWGEKWYAATKAAPGVKVLIGKGGSYANLNKADYGEICIENKAWESKEAGRPFWAVIAEWNTKEGRFLVKGLKEPANAGEKAENCHEGQTSGHSCGIVTEVPYVGTEFNKVEGPKLMSEPGDSGGPWYFLQALKEEGGEVWMSGIHHAKLEEPGKEGKPRLYQKLKGALKGLEKLNGGMPLNLLTTANEEEAPIA